MVMKPVWIWLSLAAAMLMGAASAGGIFLRSTYGRETASWAAQAAGQDIANLFVVLPAIAIALHFAYRGSVRATLLSLGLLLYIVYSYVLYAFFVHFGPWFPVYVAVLGLSAYALSGSVMHMDSAEIVRRLGNNNTNLVSALLLAFGLLFGASWLSEIVPAVVSNTSPKAIAEIGAPVNPIHVLDLAFLIPGMIVTASAARKRKPLGLLFAAPLLTFAAAMGIAILCMLFVQHARGTPLSAAPVAVMSALVLLSLFGVFSFLRKTGSAADLHRTTRGA